MQRFNVSNIKEKIYFDGSDINHITKVLRKKIGDKIECIDQDSAIIFGTIKSISPFVISVDKIEFSSNKQYDIDLYISIIKKNYFEFVVEKLNELNIKSITPVLFERTQHNIKIDFNRLNRIINESNKQCKRINKLKINDTIDYKILLELIDKKGNFIFANEKEKESYISSVNLNYKKNISLIIGPEGGFSKKEIDVLSKKCNSVTLTNTILRSETAAIYLVACVIEEIKKHEK